MFHCSFGTRRQNSPRQIGKPIRNVVSPYCCPKGRQIVRDAVGSAGRGGWKKRMRDCNGDDRGSDFALTLKRAHFHLVFHCKTIG